VACLRIDVRVEAEFLAAVIQQSEVIDLDVLRSVEPEHFQVDAYKWIVKIFQGRAWKRLEWDYLEQELLSVPDDETQQLYRNQLWALYTKTLKFEEDADAKFRTYVSFCISNAKTRAAYEGFERTSRVDYLLDELQEGVREARHVVEGSKLRSVDYFDNYDSRMERRRNQRDNPTINPRVLTGISGLDQQFVIKAPMLVDFLAPFKRYKSIFLNAIGYAAVLQGFNVLHVTYENSEEMTMDRYDAMFSELNYDRISNLLLTQAEKDAVDHTFKWMNQWPNRLKIVKATAEETTVSEVEEALDRFRDVDGWVPDVGIWDYVNIIAPSVRFNEERRDQKKAVWDLKRHTEKWGVATFTASQANMEGAKADRMTIGHRGKSIDLSQAFDLSIAIDQTDAERDEGIIVLSPHFVRGGAITIPEVVLDAELDRMSVSRELHRLWEHAQRVNPFITES